MQNLLFEALEYEKSINLLSKDGCVHYHPGVWDVAACSVLFDTLVDSLHWQCDQLEMFGKTITTKRKVAWVGDEGRSYTYSGVKKEPLAWTTELLEIKARVEELAQWQFNSCLLNLYHDGAEGMGWHSDNEPELNPAAPIASVSLGGVRKFAFKHKVDKTVSSIFLGNGSILMMHAPTQSFWQHSLLKTSLPVVARMNLTFRDIR